MTTRRCIVGLGQRAAGDDGVGPAVIDAIRERRPPAGVEAFCVAQPVELVPLLREGASVVIVDALLGTPAGVVLVLDAAHLSPAPQDAASSHGFGVAQAVELARALSPAGCVPVRFVAITIPRPERFRIGLSPAVEAAIPEAAERALALAVDPTT